MGWAAKATCSVDRATSLDRISRLNAGEICAGSWAVVGFASHHRSIVGARSLRRQPDPDATLASDAVAN
jgi:hypothetical protein